MEERRPRGLGGLLLACASIGVAVVWWKASRTALWFDEIFTAEIASLGSPREVVRRLLDGTDTHPPLDYLLRHLSIAAFGRSELAVRLASAPLLVLGCVALHAYLRRFLSAPAAAVGFLLPFTTIALNHSLEARPYALLFTGMAGALWAWGRSRDRPSVGRAVVLALVLGGAALAHVYGVLAFLPVTVGVVLEWRRGRLGRWHVAGLVGGALVASLAIPFVLAAQRIGFVRPPRMDFSPGGLVLHMAGNSPIVALLAAALYVVQVGLRGARPPPDDRARDWVVELGPILAALAVPGFVFLLSKVTGLLQVRYTIGGVAGLAALAALAVDVVPRDVAAGRRAALAAAVVMTVYGLAAAAHPAEQKTRDEQEAQVRELVAWLPTVEGPVVISNPRTFLETYTYLPPAARDRIVFPVSPDEAVRVLGHDSGDRVLPRLARVNGMKTPPFERFVAENPTFVFVDAGSWSSRVVLESPRFAPRFLGKVIGHKAWRVERAGLPR
jgi:hypothetical protein